MRRARGLVAAFAAAVVILTAPGWAEAKPRPPAPAPAPKPKPPKSHEEHEEHEEHDAKVAVCEPVKKTGGWKLEMVKPRDVPPHLARGAVLPGQPVPGMTGSTFGPDCVPVAPPPPPTPPPPATSSEQCTAIGGTFAANPDPSTKWNCNGIPVVSDEDVTAKVRSLNGFCAADGGFVVIITVPLAYPDTSIATCS